MAKTRGAGNYYIGAAATTYGTIRSWSEAKNGDVQESKDANGETDGVEITNKINVCTMVIESEAALPDSGDELAAVLESGAKKVIVVSAEVTEENVGYRVGTIVGNHYPANTIPAA